MTLCVKHQLYGTGFHQFGYWVPFFVVTLYLPVPFVMLSFRIFEFYNHPWFSGIYKALSKTRKVVEHFSSQKEKRT